MSQVIIYNQNNGIPAVIMPTQEALEQHTIEEIAAKDVPTGTPYKIVDVSEIPEDRTFRNAWEANITEPDGYGIGADAWFAEQKEKEVTDDNNKPE
jgi:hypothetical protein